MSARMSGRLASGPTHFKPSLSSTAYSFWRSSCWVDGHSLWFFLGGHCSTVMANVDFLICGGDGEWHKYISRNPSSMHPWFKFLAGFPRMPRPLHPLWTWGRVKWRASQSGKRQWPHNDYSDIFLGEFDQMFDHMNTELGPLSGRLDRPRSPTSHQSCLSDHDWKFQLSGTFHHLCLVQAWVHRWRGSKSVSQKR